MAQPGDAEAARGRLPVLAALLAFTGSTAIVFGRVYVGAPPTYRLVAAGVAAVLIAALLERFHVLVSTVASAAGLLVAVGLLIYPETTAFGFPTPETLDAIRQSFGAVGAIAARHVAPVEPLPPLLLAGVVAVWTASFASHALVARATSGVLSLLPAGALIAFADVVLEEAVRPAYIALFLVSAFAVLSTVGLGATVRWGRLIPGEGRSLFSMSALRAARRTAVPAVVSAILLPWVLPGLNAPGWWRIGRPDASISIDPIVDLRPSLRLDPPRELFSVDAPRAAYWRMLSLDRFDGQRWSADNLSVEVGMPVRSTTILPRSARPSASFRELPVTIRVSRLGSTWLPVPYEPAVVDAGVDGLLFDPDLSTLGMATPTQEGLEYEAIAAVVSPGAVDLDRDWAGDDPFYGPDDRFTSLPPIPAEIIELTRDVARGWDTPYQQALAIQDFLRGFTYDENARPGNGTDHLVRFLTQTRRGYCEQFAGAMAVMLRILGIPSRVVVGFTPGGFDPQDGLFHVTTRNAHAWVEVHFGPFGWLPFEPTPSRANPTQSSYLNPLTLGDGGVPPGGTPTDPRDEGEEPPELGGGQDSGRPGSESDAGAGGAVSRLLMALLGVAGGLAVILAAVPATKAARRRIVRSRAHTPAERVLAAHEILAGRLGDLGVSRTPAETFWEYRDRVRSSLRLPEDGLERLTRLAGRAAYAAAPVTEPGAAEAEALGREIAAAATRGVSRGRRLKALWHVGALARLRGLIAERRTGAAPSSPAPARS